MEPCAEDPQQRPTSAALPFAAAARKASPLAAWHRVELISEKIVAFRTPSCPPCLLFRQAGHLEPQQFFFPKRGGVCHAHEASMAPSLFQSPHRGSDLPE